MMARDVAKNVSQKIESGEGLQIRGGEKIVTNCQVRNMIVNELENRNQQAIA